MKTIQLTDEQYNALKNGESITIEPPKKGPKKGPWKPELDQRYWMVESHSTVDPMIFENRYLDREHLAFGNAFSSKENGQKASKAMRTHNKILQYIIENDSDWEADWDDRNQEKWYPLFDPSTKEWGSGSTFSLQAAGILYCSKECCYELVELFNNGWLDE